MKCSEKKLYLGRNCLGLETKPRPVVKILDRVFTRCPIQSIDDESAEVVQTILMSEGGGFGSSRVLPSVLLSEPAIYFTVRSIVMGEIRRIEKWKEKKEKDRGR